MSTRTSRVLIPALGAAVGLVMGTGAMAADIPTGETVLGQSVIEPAYNDMRAGQLVYLLTPIKAPENANFAHAVAPLYVIMYPTSAASSVGTVNCQHQPMDNCPDHGPELAGLAESVLPSVYGAGVWGHDHLLAPPASGGDFNIAWEPIAVLFTSSFAANTHITTLSDLKAALAAGDVIEIPLPPATFHCSVVPATTYKLGTPVTPAPPVP